MCIPVTQKPDYSRFTKDSKLPLTSTKYLRALRRQNCTHIKPRAALHHEGKTQLSPLPVMCAAKAKI